LGLGIGLGLGLGLGLGQGLGLEAYGGDRVLVEVGVGPPCKVVELHEVLEVGHLAIVIVSGAIE
jgi:hypothetical protein